MLVVAVTELRTPHGIEREAVELSRDLGCTPYDARLALSGMLPALVLSTGDRALASAIVDRLRARGQGAVLCDTNDVVAHDQMVDMRRFELGPDAVLAPDVGERLPFEDVLCLLRAMLRTLTTTVEEGRERRINVAAAAVTGGLISTKVVKTEVPKSVEEREQVLYVFRRSGGTPWILHESKTHYVGLGDDLAPTTPANFATTIRRLRAAAPGAPFDERLLRPRRSAGNVHAGNEVDLAAHLLATWYGELDRERPPYRRA